MVITLNLRISRGIGLTVHLLRLQLINSGGDDFLLGHIELGIPSNKFQNTDNFMTMGQIHLKGRFTAGVGLTLKFQCDQSHAHVNVGFVNQLKQCHLKMKTNNIQY